MDGKRGRRVSRAHKVNHELLHDTRLVPAGQWDATIQGEGGIWTLFWIVELLLLDHKSWRVGVCVEGPTREDLVG